MLVKIIAMGLDARFWETFFSNMRDAVSDSSFSAMAFTSRQELDYLESEFFPATWAREQPDFLLCGTRDNGRVLERAEFLSRIPTTGKGHVKKVLILDSLEKGLRNLLAGYGSLALRLENRSMFSITSPDCIVRSFPGDFPRIPVHDHVTMLRLRNPEGGTREIRSLDLPQGTLLAFSEIESLLRGADLQKPKEWLRDVTRAAGLKKPPAAAGIIREKNGLFLFPGVPSERVHAIRVNQIGFDHLIDRKRMTVDGDQFSGFLGAVNDVAEIRETSFHEHNQRLRRAELMTDIPIVCGGTSPLLRETLAALLHRRGHQRCFTLSNLSEGVLKEPSLLVRVDAWKGQSHTVQAHDPLVLDLATEIAARLKPLDSLMEWRLLAFRPPPPKLPPISNEAFSQQKKRLSAKEKRARKTLEEEARNDLVLQQELAVLQGAKAKLAELLEAEDTIQIWDGELPDNIQELLLFSHDKEEAGAIMQVLGGIAKKRWFDLSPYSTFDALQNLSLKEVAHYGEKGVMVITASSRDKLNTLRWKLEEKLEETTKEAEACISTQQRQQELLASAQVGLETLAREWIWGMMDDWIESNYDPLFRTLDSLRDRHERRWLNRSHIHRALVFPSIQENTEPLLDACVELFPAFNRNMSTIVPYEFDFLDDLPEKEKVALRERAREEGVAGKAMDSRIQKALAEKNEALFSDYLQVISGELVGVRVDLIIIEHRPEIATRMLTHLRGAVPTLQQTPTLLILSDDWAPSIGNPLPWNHARVILYRRLGVVSASDCAENIRRLFPL